MSKRSGPKKANASKEYSDFQRLGFISIEECDDIETEQILSSRSLHEANLKSSSNSIKANEDSPNVDEAKVGTGKSSKKKDRAQKRKEKRIEKFKSIRTEKKRQKISPEEDRDLAAPLISSGGAPERIIDSHKFLESLGFTKPTIVQSECFKVLFGDASRKRKPRDLLVSAPTGSGKTLAYLIPIVDFILHNSCHSKTLDKFRMITASGQESSPNKSFQNVDSSGSGCNENAGKVDHVNGETNVQSNETPSSKTVYDKKPFQISPHIIMGDSGEQVGGQDCASLNRMTIESASVGSFQPNELIKNIKEGSENEMKKVDVSLMPQGVREMVDSVCSTGQNRAFPNLCGLIVVPTRELAMQIKEHLDKLLNSTFNSEFIRSVVLVGGLSQDRQERLLAKDPNIVIATPGRLAEVFQKSREFSEAIRQDLKFFVLDEADRLVEKGHFEDLDIIFDSLSGSKNGRRRTMLFSATLRGVAIGKLRKKIPFTDPNPISIDLAKSTPNPTELRQLKIHCSLEEKEVYLVELLSSSVSSMQMQSHLDIKFDSGENGVKIGKRAIVFVNTIDAVRIVAQTLINMEFDNVIPMHANLQQRQRMKNMERFLEGGSNGKSKINQYDAIMVTSDVAARGLDIPYVDVVVHYHVPKARDVFLHRSGRSARAGRPGVSVALVAPHEMGLYDRVASIGSNDSKSDIFPSNLLRIEDLRPVVKIAYSLAKKEDTVSRDTRGKRWEQHAAEVLGVEFEASTSKDCRHESIKQECQALRSQLRHILKSLI